MWGDWRNPCCISSLNPAFSGRWRASQRIVGQGGDAVVDAADVPGNSISGTRSNHCIPGRIYTLSHDLSDGTRIVLAPALRIVERLLRGFETPPELRLWNNKVHAPKNRTSRFTLVVRDPNLLRQLVIERNPVVLADAYFRGILDVEGDLYAALELKNHFESISFSWGDKLALLRDAWCLPVSGTDDLKPSHSFA